MVLAVLMLGIYIGTREGIEIGRAQLEPQIRENGEKIAELQCEISALTDRLVYATEIMTFIGTASYYSYPFHGRMTASGTVFDKDDFSAAHKSLPFGMMIRVTNLENGRSIIVPITDRGPFIGERILDLSEAAFAKIAPLKNGLIRVQVTPVGKPGAGN
jgi:rare lipoprotein A